MIRALLEPNISVNDTAKFGGKERSYKSPRSPFLWPSGTNLFWVLFSTFIRKHALPEVPGIIVVENQNLLSDGFIP